MNLFLFVGNNSLKWHDYLGLSCIGDALSLLSDPAGFFEDKALEKLGDAIPGVNAAVLAAEIGKALAEAAKSALADPLKLLKKKGFTPEQLCCVEGFLNEMGKSLSTLDFNNARDKGNLQDALIDCCVADPGAVMFSLVGDVAESMGDTAKKFSAGKIIDAAVSKINQMTGNIEGIEHNKLVKDAMDYAVEKAGEALKDSGNCDKPSETCKQ